jgi:hypothetical protein
MDSTENLKAKSIILKDMVEKRDVSTYLYRFSSASLSFMGYLFPIISYYYWYLFVLNAVLAGLYGNE